MTERSAEETLEQIRGILGQTTRRRHVRHADGAFGDWLEPHLAVIRGHLDHLQGQANGTVPLPSPPPTPPPETRDMDQDSPSIPPSIGAESEIRQSAPIRQSEIRQQAAAATRDCLVPATLSAEYRSHLGISDNTRRHVRRRVTEEEPRVPETQEPQPAAPATAPTTTGDSSKRQFNLTGFPRYHWGATYTQPSDGETQSTATLPESD
jgi:hypothetical protein